MSLRLYVVRHAKSSWKGDLPDKERPIKKGRGRKDANRVAAELAERGVAFDKVLVSPAKRAQMTCAIICAALHYDAAPAVRDALYFEGEKAILQCIRNVKSKHRTIAIVGHNPDFSSFIERFGYKGDDLPTTGVALVEFDGVTDWSSVGWDNGRVVSVLRPNQLK